MFDVDGLLDLWTGQVTDPQIRLAAFRRWYTDPVIVNGAPLTAAEMTTRAEALQRTFDDLQADVLDVVDAGDKVAIAFRMGGRQVGPLPTSAGPLPPTRKTIMLRVIDILTLRDGRIAEITMVADDLGALAAIDAVQLGQASETVNRPQPKS